MESIAKDLANVFGRKPQGSTPGGQNPMQQGQQMTSQVQAQSLQAGANAAASQSPAQPSGSGQSAPLNAANLEKNTQAIDKGNSSQKPNSKAGQAPPAPTAAQPPFSFNAASPHGNPNYIGRPKDMNLQLPPARKKQKVGGQPGGQNGQGAMPSPPIGKTGTPDARRQSESPAALKPLFVCREPECLASAAGFPTEDALHQHIEDEHNKPKEDPMKFVKEELALALGLEMDGSLKKEIKSNAANDGTQPMSTTTSKQGQTPGNLAATPKSQDVAMKRSMSAMSKSGDSKLSGGRVDMIGKGATSNPVDQIGGSAGGADAWANSTIDPQNLLANLGFEHGLKGLVDFSNYRSQTPNDTPDSGKDSGASEAITDITDGATLDIGLDWHMLDADMMADFGNTTLGDDTLNKSSGILTVDPEVLQDAFASSMTADWVDDDYDFSKPFEFDDTMYSMYLE